MLGNAKYIPLATAQKMAAAGEAEARKNNWNVAIAIVDAGANLIAFHKMDDTQIGSIAVAIGKARTAGPVRLPAIMKPVSVPPIMPAARPVRPPIKPPATAPMPMYKA